MFYSSILVLLTNISCQHSSHILLFHPFKVKNRKIRSFFQCIHSWKGRWRHRNWCCWHRRRRHCLRLLRKEGNKTSLLQIAPLHCDDGDRMRDKTKKLWQLHRLRRKIPGLKKMMFLVGLHFPGGPPLCFHGNIFECVSQPWLLFCFYGILNPKMWRPILYFFCTTSYTKIADHLRRLLDQTVVYSIPGYIIQSICRAIQFLEFFLVRIIMWDNSDIGCYIPGY